MIITLSLRDHCTSDHVLNKECITWRLCGKYPQPSGAVAGMEKCTRGFRKTSMAWLPSFDIFQVFLQNQLMESLRVVLSNFDKQAQLFPTSSLCLQAKAPWLLIIFMASLDSVSILMRLPALLKELTFLHQNYFPLRVEKAFFFSVRQNLIKIIGHFWWLKHFCECRGCLWIWGYDVSVYISLAMGPPTEKENG